MTNMGCYCKAYALSAFECYPGWSELAQIPPDSPDDESAGMMEAGEDGEPVAADESAEAHGPYLFLHDNYVVTKDVFLDEGVVFDAVTPEWKSFCEDTLQFHVPDECRPIEDAAMPYVEEL